MTGPFRHGKVYVQRHKCSTCIFRPGNLMHLEEGRVEEMVRIITRDQSCIPCHQTLDGDKSVCHGQFTNHPTIPLQLAHHLGMIEYTEPEAKP